MSDVISRPSLTTFTEQKLGVIENKVASLTSSLLLLCSGQSRIHHADQYRTLAARLRRAAEYIEQDAVELERSSNDFGDRR